MATAKLIIDTLSQVDSITTQFVFDGYQNLVTTYSSAIYGLVALSVITFGYASLQGWVNLSLQEIGKRTLIIGFVLTFAMHWGKFSDDIYSLLEKAPDQIVSHIVTAIPGMENKAKTEEALQEAFSEGMNFVKATWDRGSATNLAPFWWSMLLFILLMLLVGIALIELCFAKFGLAIFLVMAPLIIPCFLFESTKGIIFDGWIKHLVTFSLMPIFIITTLSLGLMLMSSSGATITHDIQNDLLTFEDLVPYELYGLITIGLLINASLMAASMAGGMSMGISQWAQDLAFNAKQSSNDSHEISKSSENMGGQSERHSPNHSSMPSNEIKIGSVAENASENIEQHQSRQQSIESSSAPSESKKNE